MELKARSRSRSSWSDGYSSASSSVTNTSLIEWRESDEGKELEVMGTEEGGGQTGWDGDW